MLLVAWMVVADFKAHCVYIVELKEQTSFLPIGSMCFLPGIYNRSDFLSFSLKVFAIPLHGYQAVPLLTGKQSGAEEKL